MKYLLISAALIFAACDEVSPVGERVFEQDYECIYVNADEYNIRDGVYCWVDPSK